MSKWSSLSGLTVGEKSTFGASYMKLHANRERKPDRDGMNVFNARAFIAPPDGSGQREIK